MLLPGLQEESLANHTGPTPTYDVVRMVGWKFCLETDNFTSDEVVLNLACVDPIHLDPAAWSDASFAEGRFYVIPLAPSVRPQQSRRLD